MVHQMILQQHKWTELSGNTRLKGEIKEVWDFNFIATLFEIPHIFVTYFWASNGLLCLNQSINLNTLESGIDVAPGIFGKNNNHLK